MSLTLISPDGLVAGSTDAPLSVGGAVLSLDEVVPWDLWAPAMYTLRAAIKPASGGELTTALADAAEVRFGMRSIAVEDGHVILNGRRIYLRGALDQDFWPEGRSNPPSRAAIELQAQRAREMGLNVLRCHLKVPSDDYLDVADEAGLLVWCELPNWTTFGTEAARIARRTLRDMVEALGNHPSVIAWTVINEDWGTDLQHSGRDRRWLRTTAGWLKAIDPSRLVVDNSACETPDGPNFHLRTDLADFHAYRSMPDGLARWQTLLEEFARRPDWLWSPHGDAEPSGQEALVLSEFGGWGLPRLAASASDPGAKPWWWMTGEAIRRPDGLSRRFAEQALDRIWTDFNALAEETQQIQFEGLAAQIRELRRHLSIAGYVITELSDAFWEPNGLLDVDRSPKIFHDRLAEINAEDVLILDLPRTDLWGGQQVACDVTLASHADRPDRVSKAGTLSWQLSVGNEVAVSASAPITTWPYCDAAVVGHINITLPEVDETLPGELVVSAISTDGRRRARYRERLVLVPQASRRSNRPHRILVADPSARWSIADRLVTLGHQIADRGDPDLAVASYLDAGLLARVERGLPLVLLARSGEAISPDLDLAKRFAIRARRAAAGTNDGGHWAGDWTSVFAWALPKCVPGLPDGGLLGNPHAEIYPEMVLDGLDVAAPSDGVEIGLFAGWIHAPVALQAAFATGAGRTIISTLRLAPEHGPVATAILESLVQRAASAT